MMISNKVPTMAPPDPYRPSGNIPKGRSGRRLLQAPLQKNINEKVTVGDESIKSVNPDLRGAKSISESESGEKKSFSFRDFLDIINPLQHIPVVNTIYRAVTHDEIKAPARVLGGGLFGGVAGAAAGIVNAVFSKVTGKDMGEHIMALFKRDGAGDPTALEMAGAPDINGNAHGNISASVQAPIFPDTVSRKTPTTLSSRDIGDSTPENTVLSPDLVSGIMMRALSEYQQMDNTGMKAPEAEKDENDSRLNMFY
jgi:hypothetical protein